MYRVWAAVVGVGCVLFGVVFVIPSVDGAQAQSNFKNIQVLGGMTDRDIQLTMQSWAQQFGVTCFECHVQGDFASDMRERKQTARRMAQIVLALNQTPYFMESSRTADCFLCHRGSFDIPEFTK